jgi:hypothetical protein
MQDAASATYLGDKTVAIDRQNKNKPIDITTQAWEWEKRSHRSQRNHGNRSPNQQKQLKEKRTYYHHLQLYQPERLIPTRDQWQSSRRRIEFQREGPTNWDQATFILGRL